MPIPLPRFPGISVAAAIVVFVGMLFTSAAVAQEDGLAVLKQPGTHLLLRHTTAPGIGDPAGFKLGDCATQRNLSEDGRAEARRIGERLRANGIRIDGVFSSQWCRARETAELLGFGPVEDEPALNSFFDDRSTAEGQTKAVRERLAAFGAERKVALVTHQVNITALTGVVPASGEMVVVSIDEDGQIVVRGRIKPD